MSDYWWVFVVGGFLFVLVGVFAQFVRVLRFVCSRSVYPFGFRDREEFGFEFFKLNNMLPIPIVMMICWGCGLMFVGVVMLVVRLVG